MVIDSYNNNFDYESFRIEYRPVEKINSLFIAEAPPNVKLNQSIRFFYYPFMTSHDDLYRYTMIACYGNQYEKDIKNKKSSYLRKFQNDKMFLIDMLERPINDYFKIPIKKKSKIKINTLIDNTNLLNYVKNLRDINLINDDTKAIIISAAVYHAIIDSGLITKLNLNVVNGKLTEKWGTPIIDFPSRRTKRIEDYIKKVNELVYES